MTILLRGGHVIPRLDPAQVLPATDILVEDHRIAAVGPALDAAPGAAVVDCRGCLVIPGNVDAHTHAYSALARGMPYDLAPPRGFIEILRRVWWRLDQALDEPAIRASARVAGMEALLAGTTTLIDHHASPSAIDGSLDILADELGGLGIRSILAYEVTDRDGPARALAGVEENRRFLARAASGAEPLARGLVGAHASFTLSDATLAACVDLARSTGRGLHVHVAEDAADEREAVEAYGLRVLERLARAGALEPAPVLAHGVHLDPAEAALFRASEATLVHNPRSNMNNAVGRAPLGLLGRRVALGTDGIGADMFEESRAGYFRHLEERADRASRDTTNRGSSDGSAGGDGRAALVRPGSAGSTDAGWPLARLAAGARLVAEAFAEPALGRLEPGAPADLAVLDYPMPVPLTAETLAGHWIFGLSARAVRDVVVDGRLVVRDRRLTAVDQDELAAEARAAAVVLWERLARIGEHPFAPGRIPVG
ncbi:MAG TPA: amidohydrolase family protein [Candidatus Limnocylindrales bacterium]|nr:amidohydrolase family protein [Candidatus Limnocylindrales bacterium]